MKICIVSMYMMDSTLPLAMELAKNNEVDLYILLYENQRNVFVYDLSKYEIPIGIINEKRTREIISEQKIPLDDLNKVNFCCVPAKGFKHPHNYFLFGKLGFQIRKNKYDVVHIIGQVPFLLIIHYILRGKVRIHTLHESISHSEKQNPIELYFLKKINKLGIPLIFQSIKTKSQFIEYFKCDPAKCNLIYFGYYRQYRNLVESAVIPQKASLLFLGYVREYKGLSYLIDAFYQTKKKLPNVNLTIAGKWSNELLDLKDKCKNEINIVDKFVDAKELVELVQHHEIIICPYISASQSGLPMTAFAFNKPVIATELDGFKEVIVNFKTGILVKPKNSEQLAEAIMLLINNQMLYQEMQDNIRNNEFIGKFSWTEIASSTEKVYNQSR